MTIVWPALAAALAAAGALAAGSVPRAALRIEERVLVGFIAMLLVSTAVTYLLALVLGLSLATVLGGLALTAGALALIAWPGRTTTLVAWRDGWHELIDPARRRHLLGLGALAVSAALVFVLLFAHALTTDSAGNLNAGFQTVWADWSQHLTTESSFAVAHNLPPTNPLFSGQDLRYPFLPDFQSATMAVLGASPAVALALPGAILAVVIVLLVALLAVRLGAGLGAGALAAVICMIGGGLGFSGILADSCLHHGFSTAQCTWAGLVTHPADIPAIVAGTLHDLPGVVTAQPRAYDGLLTSAFQQPLPNQQWYTPLFAWWLPQRSILYGFAGALAVLVLVFAASTAARRDLRSFALAGVLLGLMPLIHIHTLLAMAVVCAVLATRYRHRGWLVLLGVTVVVAAPRLLTLLGGPHGSAFDGNVFPTVEPGWMSLGGAGRQPLSAGALAGGVGGLLSALLDARFWGFWVANTGVAVPLCAVVAIAAAARPLGGRAGAVATRLLRPFPPDLLRLALALIAVFAIANLVVVQSWDWDNTKLFVYWYLGAALLVATLVTRWWRRWWRGVAAATMATTVVLTGVLVLLRLLPWTPPADAVGGPYTSATASDARLASTVAAVTPHDAVFLTDGKPNDPVLTLAGRTAVMGYYGWLWSYGTDFGSRPSDVRTMLDGCHGRPRTTCAVFGLLRQYHVAYAEIDDRVQDAGVFDGGVDLAWWAAQGFPVVARSDHVTVYDVRGA